MNTSSNQMTPSAAAKSCAFCRSRPARKTSLDRRPLPIFSTWSNASWDFSSEKEREMQNSDVGSGRKRPWWAALPDHHGLEALHLDSPLSCPSSRHHVEQARPGSRHPSPHPVRLHLDASHTRREARRAAADHTHKWTVAVRSAASPTRCPRSRPSRVSPPTMPTSTGLRARCCQRRQRCCRYAQHRRTRCFDLDSSRCVCDHLDARRRDVEHDYHKMVGGKDDLSHFIKRVQFKLHDTYARRRATSTSRRTP